MADTTSIRFNTFGDLVSIVLNRAKIAGAVQDGDLNFIKGAINEHYVNICCERNWTWRKFDRSFEFLAPVTTGTVAVTNGSRTATFTGLTVDRTFLYRSIGIVGTVELYRIIGVNVGANSVLLEGNYVGNTAAAAQFRLYRYEFALPPDCDVASQIYVDGNALMDKQVDEVNVAEFNRMLSCQPMLAGPIRYYTIDGTIPFNPTGRVLDEMVLDYDFLGGEDTDTVYRLRLLPIWPDQPRLVHLNYSVIPQAMFSDSDKPIIPIDDRSVLIHFALYEWWKVNGQPTIAAMELRDANKKLQEMRDEFRKTDIKPKIIMNGARYRRARIYSDGNDLLDASNINESSP